MKAQLCIKSGYSFLSSTLKIDDIISYAKENEYTILGLMDHNVMYGSKEFYDKCIQNDIKPIIGIELDVEDFMICLLAKDDIGYKNIVKLSSKINNSKDSYLTISDLELYKKGVVGIIPSYRGIKSISKEKIISLFDKLESIYQSDFYLGKEVYENKECITNNEYIDILDYQVVPFNNIVAKTDRDLEYIEVLKAIENNSVIGYVRKTEGFEYSSFDKDLSCNAK